MRDQHINKVFFGDCRESMKGLIDKNVKVQMCVTSPPYFGLRSYLPDEHPDKSLEIGLDKTPDEYVERLVDVFRDVRQLLMDDGTLWLNLGDSYAATTRGSGGTGKSTLVGTPNDGNGQLFKPRHFDLAGLKPKDLIGIPWRVAFALQADGWYLRQDIIWQKPNPMPESVTDRCTKAHEYVFLLSKSPNYYFDNEAIKEPSVTPASAQIAKRNKTPHKGQRDSGMRETTGGFDKITRVYHMRNRRSVWTVSTCPYKGAHFAVFPTELAKPCILAGSRFGDTVLDPFFGSGTTGEVAQRLGRNWIGCELNSEYAPLQQQRIRSAMIGANHA